MQFTYWPVCFRNLRTPEAPPGKPYNLRVFLEPSLTKGGGDDTSVAVLRWGPPEEENGVTVAYEAAASCCGDSGQTAIRRISGGGEAEARFEKLSTDELRAEGKVTLTVR